MFYIFFIAGWLFSPFLGTAQTLRRPVAAGYTGLGAYSIPHADVYAFTANQASLAQLNYNAAAIYAERRFLVRELDHYTAVAGLTTSSGSFGLMTAYSGSSEYNETQMGLAYGRKLGNKMDVGAQFNYYTIHIGAGYGSASAISFEAGTVLHLTERLHTGFHVNNPVGGKFGIGHAGNNQAEKLSSVYSMGAGFDASEKFFISTAIEKEEDRPVSVNAGFQYKPIPQLLVRAGMASSTSSAWAGIGLVMRSFRLDITPGFHPQLGITPGLLLLFNFKSASATAKQE